MAGATLLMVMGVWVVSQATLGNALGRLGITGAPDHTAPPDPARNGLPSSPHAPGSHDRNGSPF